MKMRCECGNIISDSSDRLPYKAHFIPDQDWFGVFEAIDLIVSDVAAGRMTTDNARMAIQNIHVKASRHIYQCNKCGCLLVEDLQRNKSIYAPICDSESREILRPG